MMLLTSWGFWGTLLLLLLLVHSGLKCYEEKMLPKNPWKKENGKVLVKMYWNRDFDRWRNLSFEMPTQKLDELLGEAKKGKSSAKRA